MTNGMQKTTLEKLTTNLLPGECAVGVLPNGTIMVCFGTGDDEALCQPLNLPGAKRLVEELLGAIEFGVAVLNAEMASEKKAEPC